MRKPSLALGALLGGITSLALMALFFLGEQFAGLPFVPFDLFDWLSRVLPGDVITTGIDFIVGTIGTFSLGPTSARAKLIEQLMALALSLGGGIVFGLVVAWILRRSNWSQLRVGTGVGLVAFLGVAAVELSLGISGNPVVGLLWLALTIIGWGAVLASLLGAQSLVVTAEKRAARRAALAQIIGGSAALAVAAWGLGSLLEKQQAVTAAGQPLADLFKSTPGAPPASTGAATLAASPTPAATTAATAASGATPAATATATPLPTVTLAATTRDRIQPAPGTRPELTPNKDFYRIDINTRPPVIAEDSWMLEVAGLFDNAHPLTLKDLVAYPPVTQAITLSCISNPVGGDLIGTSKWTGVPLRDVLKDLGLKPEAKELYIEAVDGFYESVVMADIMDPRTLLVYGMNGDALPIEHGFPLRIYIPNHYGMKQPKWITRITAIDHEGPGYWVDRGWSKEARPQIVSVIDTIAQDSPVDGRIPTGGIAWAGDRSINKVEMQVDNGEWTEATLRTPPLSPLTWVQWRYDWPSSPGEHTFRVRAVDGTGALQISDISEPHPNGATGYDAVINKIS
jgi:DMSO/TMAO reductase YedYZ molybdopterin-dependent catalytic subunit